VEFVLRQASGTEKTLKKESFTTDGAGVWRGTLPTASVGTVIARVTLTDKAQHPWQGEESAIVVGEKGEPVARVGNLTLQALGGALEPGETAELVALFPDSWGAGGKSSGQVWVTLSGAGIFGTRLLEVSGTTLVHRFPIERRFGSAVYASISYPTHAGRWEERTTAFRIVPKERTLTVSIEPQKAEAPPLGEQSINLTVTDSAGKGVVAQLSVGVVDKAVYAVQSEFRPGVLDFFYPLTRNNVATFQSAEFQGYGYGESLARALSALPRSPFAAIKPPTRKPNEKERDTALWEPAVVTDRDGHARVTFTLPSNQTLWTVTAVAADAEGRFGEGTGEFASRGAVNLVASLPQFLREGDEAQGSLRVASNTGSVHYDASVSSSGAFSAEAAPVSFDLKAGEERLLPVSLRGTAPGSGKVSFKLIGGKENLADARSFTVRPGSIEESVSVSAWNGGDLTLPLPPGAQVQSVELSLQPTTVEVALANMEDLLEYPYGCLEQLVSTTVPNVALYRTLERSGALTQLDPGSRALLGEAQSRAAQGIQRILNLEVKGGGFTWFGGYSTPSPALTLIALDGLAYAVDAELVPRDEPRLRESMDYLARLDGLPTELEATRAYVLARLAGPKEAPRVRAMVGKITPGDPYQVALAVLAAEAAGVAQEPAFKAQVQALSEEADRDFIAQSAYEPSAEQFWQYPLRRVGASAVLAHAASFSGHLDIADARRRIVTVLANRESLSTFDRSTVILHSLWLIERDARELKQLAPPAVDASGEKIVLAPRALGLAGSVPAKVTHVSVAHFDGVATLKAVVRTPLASVSAEAKGMSLARTYFALRQDQLVPLKDGDAITQGEDLYVELTLDAHDGDAAHSLRSAYYVVEDGVPAGFVPLIEDKTYRGAPYHLPLEHTTLKRRALSPERATFFFEEPTWWSDTPHKFGYVLRAQFPGTFSAPPATVTDMYAATIHGRSAAARLKISPSAR
jgi:uncharacterized protein YfaS (alpha-2-macroglobulin family)